ncbi:amino acid permease [Paenibacillus sp. CGMCC 1.16610]|uniref:Amino acid permease n=1 Tax=Paenibacillus anseongense TaxID=2682845 RepID=A0ABW9UE59_9BACL|nr:MULTISPECIES: amino acid permease [Paenibacillus]MBA2943768.1 amino acid permease [Paenibacillus sp. CGMCC 1.16610]MVQ37657.1 amino acid permease [Paenibacillus anseongense]
MTDKMSASKSQGMKWWQLTLLGVACTIGTGYFLGSGIAIQMGGVSVLFMFILAAFGTYLVYDVLAKMTGKEPEQGSFQTYAAKAFGRWAGFSSGWVYWCSELLIMGSQLTALSFFTRFWFPRFPMWVFATAYALLGLGVILLGTKVFERAEHIFAIIKVSAIVMFVIIAGAAVFGFLTGTYPPKFPTTKQAFLPKGGVGIWSSFIYAFYAFGGIEIMGIMAARLKRPEEAPKAGNSMIVLLTIIYIASLALALTLIPLSDLQGKESPFQVALGSYQLPFVPHAFNAILIIAGFSTMVASLFAVTTILVSLAQDHNAPAIFAKRTEGKRQMPLPAIGFTTGGITAAVLMALFLPEKLYAYITTAAGIMLLMNWLFILLSSGRLLQLSLWGKIKRYIGMFLILAATTGTAFHPMSRPGFWISCLFIGVIGVVTWGLSFKWKEQLPRKQTGHERLLIQNALQNQSRINLKRRK